MQTDHSCLKPGCTGLYGYGTAMGGEWGGTAVCLKCRVCGRSISADMTGWIPGSPRSDRPGVYLYRMEHWPPGMVIFARWNGEGWRDIDDTRWLIRCDEHRGLFREAGQAIAKPEFTGWYSGDQKPVRPGVYRRRMSGVSRRHDHWSYWTGEYWGLASPRRQDALANRGHKSFLQAKQWRGLAGKAG